MRAGGCRARWLPRLEGGSHSAEGRAGSSLARASSISVEGTATVPIGVHDSAAAATTAYREAQAKALSDGAAKAAFLARRSSAWQLEQSRSSWHGCEQPAATSNARSSAAASDEGSNARFGRSEPRPIRSAAVPPGIGVEQEAAGLRVKLRPKRDAEADRAKGFAQQCASGCNLTADVALRLRGGAEMPGRSG